MSYIRAAALTLCAFAVIRSQNGGTAIAQKPPSAPTAWTDKSPHISAFITVNGVKLHYLDWGGAGDSMLLLTGLGNSAHVYDDFAPKFTNKFRVIALTRRGHAESDKPETGYDIANLVEDVRQFLDAVKIERVTLVGHSIAGNELTMFAGKYPQRVAKLVYLDSAYDHSSPLRPSEGKMGAVFAPFPREDNESYDAVRSWHRKSLRMKSEAIEADIRQKFARTDEGRLQSVMPVHVYIQVLKGLVMPDYSKVRAPALSFYAEDLWPDLIPKENSEKAKPVIAEAAKWRDIEREKFRQGVPNARIIVMPDTQHYCFLHREAEVVREMRTFLLQN